MEPGAPALRDAPAPSPFPPHDGECPRSRRRRDRRSRARADSSERHLVDAVELAYAHVHAPLLRARDVLADEIGADRHLRLPRSTSTATWIARVGRAAEDVECDPHRAAGREHVVDQHDDRVVDRERDVGLGPSIRSRGSSTSSRYGVMSIAPTGTTRAASSIFLPAIRWARWTPRERIPTSITRSTERFFSTIS